MQPRASCGAAAGRSRPCRSFRRRVASCTSPTSSSMMSSRKSTPRRGAVRRRTPGPGGRRERRMVARASSRSVSSKIEMSWRMRFGGTGSSTSPVPSRSMHVLQVQVAGRLAVARRRARSGRSRAARRRARRRAGVASSGRVTRLVHAERRRRATFLSVNSNAAMSAPVASVSTPSRVDCVDDGRDLVERERRCRLVLRARPGTAAARRSRSR